MTNPPRILIVSIAEAGKRLDQFLAAELQQSRAIIQRHIKDGFVTVNGVVAKAHYALKALDRIQIAIVEQAMEKNENAESLVPDILAETKDFLVINKPAGLIVQHTPTHQTGTLEDWLVERDRNMVTIGPFGRNGIVHRLDRDVSGVMVVATSNPMYDTLIQQFHDRHVVKVYTALVHGTIEDNEGDIRFRIARSASKRGTMAARPENAEGRSAHTQFTVTRRFTSTTLLSVRILTGRTHQIRTHLKAFGHPIVGDPLYGKRGKKPSAVLTRPFLHSTRIGFTDLSGDWQEHTAPMPSDLEAYLKTLTPALKN